MIEFKNLNEIAKINKEEGVYKFNVSKTGHSFYNDWNEHKKTLKVIKDLAENNTVYIFDENEETFNTMMNLMEAI